MPKMIEKAQKSNPKKNLPVPIDDKTLSEYFNKVFGTPDQNLGLLLSSQILSSNPRGQEDGSCVKRAFSLMENLKPTDSYERLLIPQMCMIHNAMAECIGRAVVPGQSLEAAGLYLERANRLAKTFLKQGEALDRHRGKGEQRMTVEHVHVYKGGKAIVGNVSPTSSSVPLEGGGGVIE